ncbi:hypothetical protein PS15m_002199 [Mucor circinelloides]
MKGQFLNRLSHFFTPSSSSDQISTSSTNKTTTDYYCHSAHSQPIVPKRTRWATLNIGKKILKKTKKYNDIPAGEWFASPLNADNCEPCKLTQCFFDEKVEILAPSASTASFITSSSTTIQAQPIPYYLSSPSCLSLELDQKNQGQEDTVTPRTLKDEKEDSEVTVEAKKKNNDFGRTYKVFSIQIYNKDDFYD